MDKNNSLGFKFRQAVVQNNPLHIVGTINAICALLAEDSGHKAIYLSGAGVANASFGLPDLGVTNLNDVLSDARRITSVVNIPLLVDIDTGWGDQFNIARSIREMIRANVAAAHIEDQIDQKRCGHRPKKKLVSKEKMVDRIKAAVDARTDSNFVIMARTDAYATESMDQLLDRACAYVEAGADMVFPEAVTSLDDYKRISEHINVPILANITEFGKTPLFTSSALVNAGVSMVLYPLTAFRAMNYAAKAVYQAIIEKGTQEGLLKIMQTRESLYNVLKYYDYEDLQNKKLNMED